MKRGIEILICAGMGLAATGFGQSPTAPVADPNTIMNNLAQQQMLRSMNQGAEAEIRAAIKNKKSDLEKVAADLNKEISEWPKTQEKIILEKTTPKNSAQSSDEKTTDEFSLISTVYTTAELKYAKPSDKENQKDIIDAGADFVSEKTKVLEQIPTVVTQVETKLKEALNDVKGRTEKVVSENKFLGAVHIQDKALEKFVHVEPNEKTTTLARSEAEPIIQHFTCGSSPEEIQKFANTPTEQVSDGNHIKIAAKIQTDVVE